MPQPFAIDLTVALLDTERSRMSRLSENDLRRLATVYTRDTFVRAALVTIEGFSRASESRNVESYRHADGLSFERPIVDSADVDELVAYQTSSFAQFSIVSLSDGWLVVPFDGGTIEMRIQDLAEQFGSYEGLKRLWVKIKSKHAWVERTMTGIFIGVIINVSTAPPNPVHTAYYCSVGVSIEGNVQQIVSDAADDLRMPTPASHAKQKEVWKARQLCLATLGLDIGPIDGHRGPRTEAAEHHLVSTYHNVILDWDSKVFREFIVREAMKHAPPHRP